VFVVHCKKDPYDIYIGRPSKWGNPFIIGKDGTRGEVIQKYDSWLDTQPELLEALPELQNKVLGCWCAPKACHGCVLVVRVLTITKSVAKDIWCPGCAVCVTAGLPKTVLHICDKNGGR
jgi:hypothetical protein